jgi:glycosyltransferase involved in cell wall biosynthesis
MHCPTTVGGNPQGLSKAERALGHHSENWTLEQTVFQYKADRVIWGKGDLFPIREYKRWGAVFRSLREGYDVLHYNFGASLAPAKLRSGGAKGLKKFIKPFYNFLYGGLFFACDLKRAYKKGMVTAVTYQGCDARQGDYCREHYPIHFCHNPSADPYTPESDAVKRQQIATFDRYADLIYAVNPDLMNVLPARAQFLPYASVDPREWLPRPLPETPPDTPHIVHAPSNRDIKGTRYILEALERLEAEGIPFRYTLVEGLPNEEAREIYEEADLLIDQLLAGFYGGLAVELMALAKPVICYIREEDLVHMPEDMVDALPIINATPDTIYKVLKRYLTTAKGQLRAIGLAGRDYAMRYHDPQKIAAKLLKDYARVQTQKRQDFSFN